MGKCYTKTNKSSIYWELVSTVDLDHNQVIKPLNLYTFAAPVTVLILICLLYC